MKNLKQDFDDKCEDESFSDWDLLAIAKDFIETLQGKIEEITGKKIEEVE